MPPPGPGDPPIVLPDGVRRVLVAMAADVLGALPDPAVPSSLRRVRSFTPAKRASAGAGSLALALERDPAFRTAVAGGWRERNAELAGPMEAGLWPPAADPGQLVAGLYLTRPEGWSIRLAQVLAVMVEQADAARAELRADGGPNRIEVLEQLVARWRSQAEQAAIDLAQLQEQLAQARRELRRLRADGDRARAQAREAAGVVEQARSEAAAARAEQLAALQIAQDRVRRAEEEADLARSAARNDRSLASARARLLLDTVVEAATGLRRELALPPEIVLPADLIAAGQDPAGGIQVDQRHQARSADDPNVLDALVRLPRAHLLVDGYNVTKTGYPNLTLAEQRARLVEGLAPLGARTGVEITCCFDGAQVQRRSAWLNRGVRVLFSEPGTTADELIRRLVRAEPVGRPLVVVSSDAEVAGAALSAGARSVPSTALLRLLGRAGAG